MVDQLPRNCEEKISEVDANSSHALKDHCLPCSRRNRSIVQNASDSKLVAWFQSLRKTDVEEYRRIMKDHANNIPQTGRGVRTKAKFDLLEQLGFQTLSSVPLASQSNVSRLTSQEFTCLCFSGFDVQRVCMGSDQES